jgi:ferric-dicitrate binding protein FerR (iron transport regulator)
MDRNQYSRVEDFIDDEYFVDWVFHPKPDHETFWQTWLNEHHEKAMLAERARTILLSIRILPPAQTLSAENLDEISNRFMEQTQGSRIGSRVWAWIGTAAAVLMLGFGIWYWQISEVSAPGSLVARVPALKTITNNGENSRLIRLSDQSLVLLRPHSTLNFPDKFGEGNREVSLSGEAFFEVYPDQKHPFLVRTGKLMTKVLGTSFDVIAPKDGKEGSVVVKTGRVQVYHTHEQASAKSTLDSIILLPNQKLVYNLKTPKLGKIDVKPVMLSPVEAEKVFSFTNAPVTDIIAKLQKAYGVEISYDKQRLKDYTVTASLSRLSLEAKIGAICKAIDARYEFEEDKIRIY